MKKGFSFFVQRAPGTAAERLTEEDRADKELFEAHFADCKTYADLCQKLEKMTSKQGNKGDQDYLEKETNQDVFGTPEEKNLGARKRTTFPHEEYEELRQNHLTEEDEEEPMPKWFAAASVGLVGKLLDAVDQKLDERLGREESKKKKLEDS